MSECLHLVDCRIGSCRMNFIGFHPAQPEQNDLHHTKVGVPFNWFFRVSPDLTEQRLPGPTRLAERREPPRHWVYAHVKPGRKISSVCLGRDQNTAVEAGTAGCLCVAHRQVATSERGLAVPTARMSLLQSQQDGARRGRGNSSVDNI